MVLKYNGTTIDSSWNVQYNGTTLDELKLNGTTIWKKQNVPSGTIIFESAVAGTYTVNITEAGNYQVIAVGGGGEGGDYVYGTLQMTSYGYGGGYINVYKTLTAGSYTAVVGGTTKFPNASANTTFSDLQAGGGHIYYAIQSETSNVITNIVDTAYQVNNNVTTITISGSNYSNYGKGANTYSASGSTPGYLKIIRL